MSVGTSDPLIGRLIDGRYQVRSRIARGGMATVYLATDLRLERRVAVKIMHGHLADDSQFKRRFIQEARSAARLAHPNVVNVFDQGQDEDSAYLVMEYLSGITLRDLLHDYGALTPEQTLDITEAVLSGLAAAHRAGIVHRDLKPENVLLADDGRIKIGDFGLARAASANTATGAALLGTIAYLSPELVTRGVADARSDIYAVGIMVYEMLTGEQPYKGEQPMQIAYQHANEQVPAPSAKNGRVPAELDELVLWATARDPEDRPLDAQELLTGLHDAEASLGTRASGRGASGRTDRTALLRTAVLPGRVAAPDPERSAAEDAATEVIGRRLAATAPVAPVAPGRDAAARAGGAAGSPTAALATAARKRRRRGWIVALVIVLVVALGAGAGWWFALGPGARVGVPDVSNLDPDAARSALVTDGFVVAQDPRSVYSLDVASSKVAGTDPKQGTVVPKGAKLTLLVSQGPQPITLPKLVGIPVADALALVKQSWTAKKSERVFNSAAADTVVDALGADGKSLNGVAQYPEKQPITLVVSDGSVPDVAGKTVDEATRLLTASHLSVDGNAQKKYSDSVDADKVIGLAQDPASLKPGDSVTLVVSEGPPPVPVPSIVGQSWTQAKAALQSAGLAWKFKSPNDQAVATSFPDFATVKSVDPGQGTAVPKGSTVTITMSFSFNG